tara:strand:+ start:130 stop:399 length:270 start_codon:yes stop_codon:yes gene_type:complete
MGVSPQHLHILQTRDLIWNGNEKCSFYFLIVDPTIAHMPAAERLRQLFTIEEDSTGLRKICLRRLSMQAHILTIIYTHSQDILILFLAF